MGCHSIEVTRYLFDRRPEATSGWVATLVHDTPLEDNSLVLLRYEGGGLGQSRENSWTAKGGLDVRLEVFGSGVALHRHHEGDGHQALHDRPRDKTGYIVEKADAQQGWLYPAWNEFINNGYLAEFRHFIGSIAREKQPSENFEDGRLVNAIMDSVYESAREGRWVELEKGRSRSPPSGSLRPG